MNVGGAVHPAAAATRAVVRHDYLKPSYPRAVAVARGDELRVLSTANADWWQVELGDGTVGIVPSAFLASDAHL